MLLKIIKAYIAKIIIIKVCLWVLLDLAKVVQNYKRLVIKPAYMSQHCSFWMRQRYLLRVILLTSLTLGTNWNIPLYRGLMCALRQRKYLLPAPLQLEGLRSIQPLVACSLRRRFCASAYTGAYIAGILKFLHSSICEILQ